MPQAAAYLHWADWLRAAAIKAGKRPLFINLDETSISRSWPISRQCSEEADVDQQAQAANSQGQQGGISRYHHWGSHDHARRGHTTTSSASAHWQHACVSESGLGSSYGRTSRRGSLLAREVVMELARADAQNCGSLGSSFVFLS